LAELYGLAETATAAYAERTERNVLASDGTIVFGDRRSPGSMLTARLCRQHGKPYRMVPLENMPKAQPPHCEPGCASIGSGRSTSPAIAPARHRASARS
jgi:hypothetical protein